MKTFLIVLLAIAGVIALAVGGIYIHNKSLTPEDLAMENTTARLRSLLKDPESMKIRASYIVFKSNDRGSTDVSVCGVVDGKNSFGGYTGGTKFVSVSTWTKDPDTFSTWIVELEDATEAQRSKDAGRLSPFDSVYWNSHCVDAMHPAATATQ